MDEGIAGSVADWESRPFTDGYRGLQALADESFSGAVEADGTWALFINGRVVGVYEEFPGSDPDQQPTDIDRFEGASGTAYRAPHPSLPLLFAMQLRDGEVVIRSTTSDRPVEDVHRELEEEGFTGYLELSEHVLSGDYYVVYQRGKSMNAAFIGNARRLKTGEEAFDRTTTEVGVYEVRAVPVSVVDIPEPTDDAALGGAPGADDDAVLGESTGGADGEQGDVDGESGNDRRRVDSNGGTTTDAVGPADPSTDRVEGPTDAIDGRSEPGEREPSGDDGPAGAEGGADPVPVTPDESTGSADEQDGLPPAGAATPAIIRIEEEWEASRLVDGEATAAVRRISGEWTATRLESVDEEPDAATDADSGTPVRESDSADSAEPSSAVRDATPGAATASEVDRLERRLEALAGEQEQLAATVEQLQSQLSSLLTGPDGEPFEPSERRSPGDALAETRLLVRARSATDATLADVATGAGREAVTENLLFDPRTPFPAAETAVDGEPFEQFFEGAPAYQLVTWLLTTLPFEIRDSNRVEGLRDVYEALPSVDRATFGTAAAVADHAFDVTLRDGEGEPLLVVRIEESPDPPGASTYEALLRAARDANAEHDSLAGAFLMTTSYVDESALDPIEDATKGGVFSRDKRESYVNVSGGGFHVCVVEGGETFRLRVPQL